MHSVYCDTATYLLYYNCPKGEGLAAKRQDEKISKRFEKGLDNPLPMWYNKDTVRGKPLTSGVNKGHSPQVGRQ